MPSNTESPFHPQAEHFLTRCAAGPEIVCLGWITIMSYLRIATHPGIFAQPLSPREAMVICTHDRDYRKFDFHEVVDPIKA